MTKISKLALKASAILWMIWGLVHMMAGVIIIPADPTGGFQAIADAVDPLLLAADYHPAVGGVLDQHGFNLLWIGFTTIIGAVFIWRANMTSIWVTALVGGMADIGYFVFVDLPGYTNFVPGTLMTIISASAILLSGWVWLTNRDGQAAA